MEEGRPGVMLLERNDELVCGAFRRGEFDYLDAAGEIPETDFFRAIASKKILEKLASSDPPPLKKHDVPLWVPPCGIASNVWIPQGGTADGAPSDPSTVGRRDALLSGLPRLNDYDRQTPCDADSLRKTARRTDAVPLCGINRDVAGPRSKNATGNGSVSRP